VRLGRPRTRRTPERHALHISEISTLPHVFEEFLLLLIAYPGRRIYLLVRLKSAVEMIRYERKIHNITKGHDSILSNKPLNVFRWNTYNTTSSAVDARVTADPRVTSPLYWANLRPEIDGNHSIRANKRLILSLPLRSSSACAPYVHFQACLPVLREFLLNTRG